MRFLVLVPTLDPQALRLCLRTMAPELRENVLVIDNTDPGIDSVDFEVHRGTPHQHERDVLPRHNLGTARSMNVGAQRVLAGKADAVVWVSTSMRFDEDGGKRLLDACTDVGVIGLPAQLHAFILTRKCFEAVGLFDAGLAFPGYFEDTDWRRRAHLAGVHPPVIETGGHAVDSAGMGLLQRMNRGKRFVNFEAAKARYIEKWGAPHGEETFETPWGNRDLGLDYCQPRSREQLIEMDGLGLDLP